MMKYNDEYKHIRNVTTLSVSILKLDTQYISPHRTAGHTALEANNHLEEMLSFKIVVLVGYASIFSLSTEMTKDTRFFLMTNKRKDVSLNTRLATGHHAISCGVQCAVQDKCKSFLYNPHGQVCHIYSALFHNSSPTSTKEGAVVFIKEVTDKGETLQQFRLFIAPFGSKQPSPCLELDVDNFSIQKRHSGIKRISSVAYTSKRDKVFIGTQDPPTIVAYSLDTESQVPVRDGVATIGMVVDHDRELVFMAANKPHPGAYRMTIHGKLFTSIYNSSGNVWSVSLDTKQKLVFVNAESRIFSMNYDGDNQNDIIKDVTMCGIAVDPILQMLYYNNGKDILRFSLTKKDTAKVALIDGRPDNLKLHGSYLYAVSLWLPNIYVVNVINKTVSEIKHSPTASGNRLCIIHKLG